MENKHIDIGVYSTDNYKDIFDKYNLDKSVIDEFKGARTSKFESYEGFDIICLNRLDRENISVIPEKVFIYLSKSVLLIFCADVGVRDFMRDYVSSEDGITVGKTALFVLRKLISDDDEMLENIETDIDRLEIAILSGSRSDCIKQIIKYRHTLLMLKTYYEQYYDVLDGIMENSNEILDNKTLKYIKIISNRVDRLNNRTQGLRELITQVREAYQAQVDIELNKTMKVFAVVTTVFFPLSLIAGWYGMNLQMPEYDWKYGYPAVLTLSIAVIGFCIYYFKKNKWF